MSTVELLPHNEEGYQMLIGTLENYQMASIDRATGTGKSFIILKYLYEHRDKRILYMAPTYPIIDQLFEEHMIELGIDKQEFEVLDFLIYPNITKENMEELAKKYDIIILDEYHRCGAKKWGKQINLLLDIIKKKYPNTKVIGTTATEIRYLDNLKNMNHILFDGVCASKLSLADAILKGILPVPVYINVVYNLLEKVEKIERRVQSKAFYKENMVPYLKTIDEIKTEIYSVLNEVKNVKEYLGKDGKYLVFSSTIKKIEQDRKYIKSVFEDDYDNEYVVHSGFTKEQNKRSIKAFRNSGKGNSFLYSINILNEGLHVKDVDAIFMLRETTSPIIYFQQLGRLLSYSRRKKEVVVFDFVNNIKNNPFIYQLYQDVVSRAEELSKQDPDNKELYQKILKQFKVVNLTSEICQKTDELNDLASNENLKKERLNTSIMILEGKKEASYFEKIQAYVDLFKLKHYLNLEMFRRVQKLNVVRPSICSLEEDEFLLYIKDKKVRKKFDTEHKDDKSFGISENLVFRKEFESALSICNEEVLSFPSKRDYIEDLYNKLVSFIKENHRFPKIDGNLETKTLETQLFYKRIIFENDLKTLNYTERLNELLAAIKEKETLNKLIAFTKKSNGYLPASSSDDLSERKLAIDIHNLEKTISGNNLELLMGIKENAARIQREVVIRYVKFIKEKKRYPLMSAIDEKEKEIATSFAKITHLTEVEKKAVDKVTGSFNRRAILKNSYLALQEKKKQEAEKRQK